ncbi:MAG: hypothetical protein ABIE14_01405, partial [Patescibacteria group bacterium]
MKKRNYIQARNLLQEAKAKIKDFNSVIGRTKDDYDKLRQTDILCNAFSLNGKKAQRIVAIYATVANKLYKSIDCSRSWTQVYFD